ncbi:Copper amine oxidase 1 [Orchesella cincta]|uniref:Amine oxidase n=1 Tax=Orchesella cincta TaxID=48709 RepID=A0A1D2NA57_ORCCI|nr:Copper amine oxidase 1 [Orchesella cincta]
MSPHPLDPLTPEEISTASRVIRENHQSAHGWIFNSITLQEPSKQVLAPLLLEESNLENVELPRKAFVLLIEKLSGTVYEVVVNLTDGAVEKFEKVPQGFQPTLSPEDCLESERIVRESTEVQERCRNLGLNNMDLVTADPWSVGYNAEPEFENRRLVQLFMYTRNFEGDNHYAHPLPFVVVVDIISGEVISIEDLPCHTDFKPKLDETVSVPTTPNNYDPDFLPPETLRTDVKLLEVVQPEGPSFTITGNEIQWQKYKIRISFNYREGLVLHNIRYEDGDKVRPLFYRISLSEMVVPYGDPRPPYHRKCAYDIGDYGLGFCANSLALGCDCLGTIKYFDGVLNNHEGEPVTIKNAVCLHEEDVGILQKHTEYRNGKAVVSRSRRLVLSFIATVVNYEYAFYCAQFHQHIFCMRMDPMIDGLQNSVTVTDVKALEQGFGSEKNPYGQGFTVVETPLSSTKESVTDVQAVTNRTWRITNPSSIHAYTGKPVGWKLIPNGAAFPSLLAGPESWIRKRAGFATHSLWITKQKDDQLYAGGLYINQSKGGDGLIKWVEDDENIQDEDIVLWHSFGVTHIPRVEDFPVMPIESTGFTLKPNNFFTTNPGLDVPPPRSSKSKLAELYLGATKCH